MGLLEDFIKVRNHLGLSSELMFEVNLDSEEGFFSEERQLVSVGMKNSRPRRLLIHECLHAKGMKHYEPPTYQPVMKWDDFSANLEKKIFALSGDVRT